MTQEVKSDVLKATGIVAGSVGIGFAAGKTAQKMAMNHTADERAAISSELQKLLGETLDLKVKFPAMLEKYNTVWGYKKVSFFEPFRAAVGEQERINTGYEKAKELRQDFLKGLKGEQYKELQNAMKKKSDINTLSHGIQRRYKEYLKYLAERESVRQFEQARLDVINCNKTINSNIDKIKQLQNKLSDITKQCSNHGFRVGACVALAVGSVAALCLFPGNSRETA